MKTDSNKRVPLTGYSQRLSARPGQTFDFKLSSTPLGSEKPNHSLPVKTWLTHCVCADPNPAGPGIVENPANEWYTPQNVSVEHQDFQAGSYGICRQPVSLQHMNAVELNATVWPTLQTGAIQCIASIGALSLGINDSRQLCCVMGKTTWTSRGTLELRSWTQVQLRLHQHSDSLTLTLSWQPASQSATTADRQSQEFQLPIHALEEIQVSDGAILIAAQMIDARVTHHFNGKIEAPALSLTGESPAESHSFGWDFSENMSSCTVPGLHNDAAVLELVNFPARAMTGSRWQGQEMSWRHAPALYGAIHFHEDDLVNANWNTTFSWQVPVDMPSGVYLMHISDGTYEDALPLFICAPRNKPAHRLCVLIPTFTYAIYGNHARPDWDPSWQDSIAEINAYPYNPAEYSGYGLSTYNYHSDGSGICHASHLRPLFNLRPGYVTFAKSTCSGLRHFQADSHLFAWLNAMQRGFDVITDRELHDEGVACINQYDLLMTTSHPEYHTSETLDALTHYRNNGGHLSYLGGNGFYWRIALHPEHPDTLEIRRAEDGIRAWAAEPGEYYQAFDGQYGGLWRRNGRPPQALCGLGFSAQGQFNGSYYRKRAVDDAMAWIFEGIEDDIIGDFGLSGGGAAGFELDRADARLGTPANAVVIASSEKHGDDFILVPEEMLTHITTLPGPEASELLRADIVWFDVPGGGSVFSVGSITFCGSLPHNHFDNSVSTLLRNVVDHVLTT